MNALSDNDLMLAVRDGDVERLGTLFEHHHRSLYSFFLRLTHDQAQSEDLVQEVFLRILKYRHTFRGEGAFVVWIYQIAHNVHRDHLGQWKRAFPGRTAAMDGIDGASVVPPDQLQRREEQALLHTALNALPPEQREVLLLSRFQGLAYHEIAAILGCTVGAVKVRVYRCPKRAFPPKSARYLAGALVAQTTDPSACPGDGLAARRRRPRPEPASSE